MFEFLFIKSRMKKERELKHIKVIDDIFQDVVVKNMDEDLSESHNEGHDNSKLSHSFKEDVEFDKEKVTNVVNFKCCFI